MKVYYSEKTIKYLTELTETLYFNDYFGFREDAKRYVEELIREINASINHKVKKVAPEYFNKYGDNLYYASYRKNKNTSWYIFFNKIDDDYYVYYIGNNHSVAQYL